MLEYSYEEQSRLHNDANILTMPARHLEWKEVLDIVKIFISTKFEGGRHERRVKKKYLVISIIFMSNNIFIFSFSRQLEFTLTLA